MADLKQELAQMKQQISENTSKIVRLQQASIEEYEVGSSTSTGLHPIKFEVDVVSIYLEKERCLPYTLQHYRYIHTYNLKLTLVI
jgi:hypothetical protein